MRITCRKCRSILDVEDSAQGTTIICPVCQAEFRCEADSGTDLGFERPRGFSFGEFFSEVFKHHDDSEIESYFMVGTAKTTPDVFGVDPSWPKPWMFTRLLLAGVGIYYALFRLWNYWLDKGQFDVLSIPDLLVFGSFVVPLASVVLFFELNARRNVSIYQVIKLIFAGGILSLVLTDFFNLMRPSLIGVLGVTPEWQASLAGPIEEAAKLAAVLLMVRGTKYRYTLNGMLFGAAVGVGFAMFESAGYALKAFLSAYAVSLGNSTLQLSHSGQLNDAVFHGKVFLESLKPAVAQLNDVIVTRGILAPVGHVAYSAIAVGAFWRIKGANNFSWEMLRNRMFLVLFAIAVALHAFWNSPLFPTEGIPWIKVGVVALVGWGIVLALTQDGIRQIRREQDEIVGAT